MTLKTIKLGIAERQIAQGVLIDTPKKDIDTARLIRYIRDKLELRQASHRIDELVKEAREEQAPAPDWDDLLEIEAPREFTIDEFYLQWFRDRLQAKEWDKVKRALPDGTSQTVEIVVTLGQMVAIANLADAVAAALELVPAAPESKEEGK